MLLIIVILFACQLPPDEKPSNGPWKITADHPMYSDSFGYSVSSSGDYMLVGAPGADSYQGAAYIFHLDQGSPGDWRQIRKLVASDAAVEDLFGYSASISGDFALVSAHCEDGTGTHRGAAYLFYRNQGGPDHWGEVKKLTASDAENNDYFGCSVVLEGQYALACADNAHAAPVVHYGAVCLLKIQ
jgi:hypothetical protein